MVVTSIAFFLRFLFQLLLEFGQECRLCSPGFVANRSGLDSCERPRMDEKKGRWSSNDRNLNTWGCVFFFLLDLSREWFFFVGLMGFIVFFGGKSAGNIRFNSFECGGLSQ